MDAAQPTEVLNLAAVRAALAPFARDIGYREGRDWFSLPGVLRFAAGDAFTARLDTAQAEAAIAEHAAGAAGRALLMRKLGRGGTFRLFVPAFLQHLGPDFSHVADWIRALPEDNPRMVRKLARVTVPAAVGMADRWSAREARKAARAPGQGRVGEAFDPGTGRVWVELLDAAALQAESGMMCHCVRSYGARLAGGTRIFSLRNWQGAAMVTAEIRPGGGKPVAGQIRGLRNAIPGHDVQADILALLVRLDVAGDSLGEAASAGLCIGGDGAWHCISDVAERADFAGMPCLALGDSLYAVSPSHPDALIAAITGRNGWWRHDPGGYGPVMIRPCGGREFGLGDQRAVARLATAARCATVPLELSFLRLAGGVWQPWADTCQIRDFGGVDCLVDGSGGIHVPRGGDRAHVLVSIRRPDGTGARESMGALAGSVPGGAREWSAEDVRRIACALTAAGATLLDRDDGGLRKAGLDRCPDGSWARFQDHMSEHPVPGPDGRLSVWLVAPWVARLKRGGKTLLTVHRDMGGDVIDFGGPMQDGSELAEAARLLNGIGARPAENWWSGRFRPTRWCRQMNGTMSALAHIGGRWHAPASADEVCRHLAAAGGGRRHADPLDSEAACSLLPSVGHSVESDMLLARHLAEWAKRQDSESLREAWRCRGMADGMGSHGQMRGDPVDRLLDAGRLAGLMTPAGRTAAVRAAMACMRGAMARTRRPKGRSGLAVSTVHDLLRLFWHHMPQRFLDRAVPWCQGVGSSLLPDPMAAGSRPASEPRLDTLLLDMRDAMPAGSRAACAVAEAACGTLWRLCRNEALGPKTPAEAEGWVRCVVAAAGWWHLAAVRDATPVLRALIGARAAEAPQSWACVQARLAAAEAALPPERGPESWRGGLAAAA